MEVSCLLFAVEFTMKWRLSEDVKKCAVMAWNDSMAEEVDFK